MHVLVVGSGSVGKRHACNLKKRQCEISAVDPRADRLAEIGDEVDLGGAFHSMEAALAAPEPFDGVVIASPPSAHVEQAGQALHAGLPVLLEKPVAPTLADAQKLDEVLQAHTPPLLLGYTWRWWPPIRDVAGMVSRGTIGTIFHAQFVMSAHLADWHPWEPYQDFFMAKKELGGGALLDESHWIDLMVWLFGMPKELYATIDKLSPLEIDTDDSVEIILGYEDGPRSVIHLDIHGRPHQKYIRLTGTRGTIIWSAESDRVTVYGENGEVRDDTTYAGERNEMFQAVGDEFLEMVRGGEPKGCLLSDGLNALQVIEAARRSSATGQRVRVAGAEP